MNLHHCLESDNQIKKDIVLDTSSVNKIIKNDNLSDLFFKIVNKKHYRVVVPYKAFSELSNDYNILNKFNDIYQKNINLRIGEPVHEKIQREINYPIESNLYLKRDIDLFGIAKECYEDNKQHNIKQKTGWKQNCRNFGLKYLEDHNITAEERNQRISELLKLDKLLADYENHKDYWVLNILAGWYKIEQLPVKEIISNKNRYRYINLLHYLMLFNIWRSPLSGNSE